jgi:uncharacterized FlaG/YvyC family protein
MSSPINISASVSQGVEVRKAVNTAHGQSNHGVSKAATELGNISNAIVDGVTLDAEEQSTVNLLESGLKAIGSVKMGIELDSRTQKPVIRIFDKDSGSEILQIPAKHSRHIADTIELVKGLIFDKKV